MYLFYKSLPAILSKEERFKLLIISLMLSSLALMEVAGLALISFIVLNLETLDLVLSSSWLYVSFSTFFSMSNFSPSLIFCLFVACYSIITVIISILVIRHISQYSQLIGVSIKSKVIKIFLAMNWEKISQIPSSEKISRIINDTEQAADAIYFSMHLFSKSILAFLIIILLFIFNPVLTLVIVGLLAGSYLMLYKFFDSATKLNSKTTALSKDSIIRSVKNMIGSLKEILFYKNSNQVLQNISKFNKTYAHARAKNMAFSQMPRFIIDSMLLIILVGVLLYLQLKSINPAIFFPTISVFGIAGLKLLPAFQNIFYFAHEINTRTAFLVNIAELLNARDALNQKKYIDKEKFIETIESLEFTNINFKYASSSSLALNNLGIKIQKGEKIALFGPSGSGKSTFVDILLGLVRPTQGKIMVNNEEIEAGSMDQLKEKFSYVPQKIYFLEGSLLDNINFGLSEEKVNMKKSEDTTRQSLVKTLISNLSIDLQTNISDETEMVSGGQKQLIGIGRALNRGGEILILDESTSAMDYDLERKVLDAIFNSSFKTVIAVTHKQSLLKNFDKIALFNKGKIIDFGSFDYLNANNKIFQETLKNYDKF
jgi:ATP-binding cassette, subfamily B, bacterial PglK